MESWCRLDISPSQTVCLAGMPSPYSPVNFLLLLQPQITNGASSWKPSGFLSAVTVCSLLCTLQTILQQHHHLVLIAQVCSGSPSSPTTDCEFLKPWELPSVEEAQPLWVDL